MARASGKLILLGEHAVVYGKPAIAVPLQAVYVDVTSSPTAPNSGLTITSAQLEHQVIQMQDESRAAQALIKPLQLALKYFGISTEPDLRLHIQSTIPIASGFGSGAALATALIRSLCAALGKSINHKDLNALVYEVEKLHHGTPSGIDNTVIVYEQPVYFVRDESLQTFNIGQDLTLLVAHVGHATPTYETVGDVRRLYEANPAKIGAIFNEIAELVEQARQHLENGDAPALGKVMNQNHSLLQELTVSDDTLDVLCQVARENGAWGAKLSGGGRGGNFIALVAPEKLEDCEKALKTAGAIQVIRSTLKNNKTP